MFNPIRLYLVQASCYVFNLSAQGQIYYRITLVSTQVQSTFLRILQKNTLINWKICQPKVHNTNSLCLGLCVLIMSASFTHEGKKKTKLEIITERQSNTREGWATFTFDLLAYMPQQETSRLPEESLTHSASWTQRKHSNYSQSMFHSKTHGFLKNPINYPGWICKVFVDLVGCSGFFYPKLLFPRVRYVKLKIGNQNSIILILMLHE